MQVRLQDGTTVTVREPKWCTGQHEDGLQLVDLMHDGKEIALTVATGHGRVEVLNASLTQHPYTTAPEDRAPRVTVLLGGEWASFDPDGLRLLAAGLVVYAGQLRDMATVLSGLLAEEGQS